MHARTVMDQATGDTPPSVGWRRVRKICGTTITTPSVAPT